jgi:hypothetical protein
MKIAHQGKGLLMHLIPATLLQNGRQALGYFTKNKKNKPLVPQSPQKDEN